MRALDRHPSPGRLADPAPVTEAPAPKLVTRLDPALLPDEYAMPADGTCLEPVIMDGACLLFDTREPFKAGDLVVLYRRPELVKPGQHQAIVKRLVTNLPPGMTLPYREHPESEVHVIVIVEQLNPPRRFAVRCQDLLAIHKCLGPVPADRVRFKVSDEELEAMHRAKPRPRARRRRRTPVAV